MSRSEMYSDSLREAGMLLPVFGALDIVGKFAAGRTDQLIGLTIFFIGCGFLIYRAGIYVEENTYRKDPE
jgi:hypothetical protein